MTAGRERYARIAAATGMEARDPFMDKRVLEYCSRLPGHLRLHDGWPKAVLREVSSGILPDEVVWTHRKPHVGWRFSEAVAKLALKRGELSLAGLEDALGDYVDGAALNSEWNSFSCGGDAAQIRHAYILATWLRTSARRPVS